MQVLHESGAVTDKEAGQLSLEIAARICKAYEGQQVYIPRGNLNGHPLPWFKLEERDWQIYREYNGTNREDVLGKYNIGKSRLYQIIAFFRSLPTMERRKVPR